MGFWKDVWRGYCDMVDYSTRANKDLVLKGFIGAMPIYGKRGPNVFLPQEDEEDDERSNVDEEQ